MQIHDARLSGSAFVSGNVNPDTDLTHCLGLPNLRWKTIYGGTISGTFVGDGSGLTGIASAGDTNYYPTALTFNSANGNLQLSGVGMSTLTANLDGRYCTTDTNTDTNSYLISQSFNNGTGWFCSFRNDGLPVISTSFDGRWVLISDFQTYSQSVSNSIELLSSSFEATSESLSEWSKSLDLYDGWKLYVDDSDKGVISNDEIVNVKAGTGVELSYSTTNNTITINSTSTTGPQGFQGFQGLVGSTGSQGRQGFQGLTGDSITGPQGRQGFQGVSGGIGATGLSGDSITGPQGFQGVSGGIGATGLTGPQGNQGLSGGVGATGVTGPQGNQGLSGSVGATGVTGATGTFSTADDVQIDSLGVGTPASGVTGEIRATNNITAYYSSDKRIKTNIIKITNPLEKIEKINGVEFNWTDEYLKMRGGIDGVFIRKDNIGVIAQEIEEILPQVVIDRWDGIKAVNYEMIIPLLIESIKELKKELEEIKKKI